VILPCSLYLALFTHCLSSCIRCLEHLFSFSFGFAGIVLSSITFALTIFSLIYWSHLTHQRQIHRNCFIPTDEEYYNWIFMLALVASSSWAIAAGYVWQTNNWREISDSLLVAYTYIQLGFIVIVTGNHFSYRCRDDIFADYILLRSATRTNCPNQSNSDFRDADVKANIC
jgi:hypothetical protein